MDWKLADAKNRLSELVTKATTEGPQTIRRRGQDAVVVLKEQTYLELMGGSRTLMDHLLSAPSLEGVIPLRDRRPAREVKF